MGVLIQFVRSFKKLFSTIFFQPSTVIKKRNKTQQGSNCEEDDDFECY